MAAIDNLTTNIDSLEGAVQELADRIPPPADPELEGKIQAQADRVAAQTERVGTLAR